MKCVYCGFESENNFIFCPKCGKEAPVEVYGDSNPAANHILSVLKDRLFFVLCILLTVASGTALLGGSINLIAILATIFIWLVYNESLKNNVDSKNLRHLSGTTYAYYIIMLVCAVISAVGGVLALLFSGFIFSSGLLVQEVEDILFDSFGFLPFSIAASSAFLIVVLLVFAVLFLFVNVVGLRIIHRFVKSVYQSVDMGVVSYQKSKSAENWLMILGIISGISALSQLDSTFAFCSSASIAAAEIVASLLIKKHFSDYE